MTPTPNLNSWNRILCQNRSSTDFLLKSIAWIGNWKLRKFIEKLLQRGSLCDDRLQNILERFQQFSLGWISKLSQSCESLWLLWSLHQFNFSVLCQILVSSPYRSILKSLKPPVTQAHTGRVFLVSSVTRIGRMGMTRFIGIWNKKQKTVIPKMDWKLIAGFFLRLGGSFTFL